MNIIESQAMLKRANILINSLQEEADRWKSDRNQILTEKIYLAANSLIEAASINYFGKLFISKIFSILIIKF